MSKKTSQQDIKLVDDILKKTKNSVIEKLRKLGPKARKLSSSAIEELVLSEAKACSIKTKFKNKIVRTPTHAFPDIMIGKKFGIEVKMTIGDKWTSTGNSILESTRVEDAEKVFIFFVKIGGKVDVKFRAYEECLNNIVVTHFPRYTIDMNLPLGKSIFDKMELDYEKLRKSSHPVRHIRNYYRKQLSEGEELWWMDNESSSDPVIKNFNNLSHEAQEKFIIDSMVLFPEIFGSNNAKFSRPSAYLFTEFNAISSNMRDKFSAGGQATVKINGASVKIPKILHKMLLKAKKIKKTINSMNKDKLVHYWRIDKITPPVLKQWKGILNSKSSWAKSKIAASDIFDLGLHA